MVTTLERLGPGTTELYVHPAEEHTPELERLMPGYRHREELAALVSPRVRRTAERAGVEIASWREVAAGAADGRAMPHARSAATGVDGRRDPA